MLKGTIIGNLGRDAEVRVINQKEYFSMNVGTSRRKEDPTVWVQVLYPKRNDTLGSLLVKGRQVYATGDQQVGVFTTRSGETVPEITVWASELQLLGSQQDGQRVGARPSAQPAQRQQAPVLQDRDDDLPF